MKRPAIILLLACAAALPMAAVAQSDGGAMLTTKWSLKQPRKKAPGQSANATVTGPAVPAPQRLKLPRVRQHHTRERLPDNRTNAAPAIASMIRKKT
ncbi:MAG: hypothetical protein JWN69_2174 [Alphaproteobacteria bacterium]|nr:hypothetical protein [Alphaproteobacteria bacterium]